MGCGIPASAGGVAPALAGPPVASQRAGMPGVARPGARSPSGMAAAWPGRAWGRREALPPRPLTSALAFTRRGVLRPTGP
eukprot:2164971-Alexandrium_andersonii.AAC.1